MRPGGFGGPGPPVPLAQRPDHRHRAEPEPVARVRPAADGGARRQAGPARERRRDRLPRCRQPQHHVPEHAHGAQQAQQLGHPCGRSRAALIPPPTPTRARSGPPPPPPHSLPFLSRCLPVPADIKHLRPAVTAGTRAPLRRGPPPPPPPPAACPPRRRLATIRAWRSTSRSATTCCSTGARSAGRRTASGRRPPTTTAPCSSAPTSGASPRCCARPRPTSRPRASRTSSPRWPTWRPTPTTWTTPSWKTPSRATFSRRTRAAAGTRPRRHAPGRPAPPRSWTWTRPPWPAPAAPAPRVLRCCRRGGRRSRAGGGCTGKRPCSPLSRPAPLPGASRCVSMPRAPGPERGRRAGRAPERPFALCNRHAHMRAQTNTAHPVAHKARAGLVGGCVGRAWGERPQEGMGLAH